jgi:hypothetical protein
MASASQQTFISQAQTVQALWNQVLGWYASVRNISNLTTKDGAQVAWKAMATAAQNADGSVGAADGTPVETHVITAGNLGMSADDVINALNDMTMLCSVLDGTLAAASYQQVDHRGDAPSVTNLTR